VVLVVGLGLVLLAGWVWWYSGQIRPGGEWFAYAPNTDTYFMVGPPPLSHLLVPLAFDRHVDRHLVLAAR
jgi:hypothetical protein